MDFLDLAKESAFNYFFISFKNESKNIATAKELKLKVKGDFHIYCKTSSKDFIKPIENVTYYKQMKTYAIEDKWGIDLSTVSNDGKTIKQFDFVVKTDSNIYLIEVNFYNTQGSKLNETARSYKTIQLESEERPLE